MARELRVLAGCGWHTVRRACPQGVIMGAHAAGRVVEALAARGSERSAGVSPAGERDAGDGPGGRRAE
jgi:hypothetical protein